MFQGFYNLTSGMITQNRNLNVVSNNIANVLTPGYKKDTMVSSTFLEELVSRTGNIDKDNPEGLGDASRFRSALETITDYEQGALEITDNPLDCAITSEGFFRIDTGNGELYTRNGSFAISDDGYLVLPEGGRVMGKNGPILLGADDFTVDGNGLVYTSGGDYIDQLDIVTFDDMAQLRKTGGSLFASDAAPVAVADPSVEQKTLERSNVDATGEFSKMIESQRALQSAAQVLKIYDQLMGKATTQLGNI